MSLRDARPAVRWAACVAIAVVFAIACAYLSHWQFSRNAERSRELALIAANYDASPVPLAELIPEGGALAASDEWRPVALTGRYLADDAMLVRNRAHGGTAAFEVLVPFELSDGRVFLVNRGWVPPGEHQQNPDDVPAPPTGEVTVVARLQAGEPLPASGRSAPDGQVPTIHLPLVADLLGGDGARLEQSAYGIMVSESPAPTAAPRALEAPPNDPGPYLSYAVQWILFAVMGFVFIWYVIRSERRARREDAADAAEASVAESRAAIDAPRRAASRGARTRDRDMRDEDAMLDRVDR